MAGFGGESRGSSSGGKAFDEFRDGILAIGADQFGHGGKQARLREAVAVDAVVAGLSPRFLKVAECELLLLVIRHGFTSRQNVRRRPHRLFTWRPSAASLTRVKVSMG